MDDDLMPNDGTFYFPREPQDQVIARKKEKAQILESLSVLQELLARWNEKIAFYESVKSIPEEVKLDPKKFMVTIDAHSVIVEIFEAEREYIESLISSYKWAFHRADTVARVKQLTVSEPSP